MTYNELAELFKREGGDAQVCFSVISQNQILFGNNDTKKDIISFKNEEPIKWVKEVQEEPISEKKCMFTNDNYTDEDRKVLCEDCKEKCEYNKKEEPVSANSKKHISLVTERMLKEGPIPTLRGEEKADFENEFNRFKQITGMINWPSREEIYKNVILWFIAWSRDHLKIGDIVDKSEIDKQPISEDLEIAANEWDAKASFTPFYMALDNNGNPYEIKQDYTTHAESFKAGAKWQKENLWNPADGDDLPEYEREVVVFTQNYPDDAGIMSVAIGHRPNPDGWDGKSLATGEVEHYTPKTYGKGGWNIPNVVLWLDAKLPKEIEL